MEKAKTAKKEVTPAPTKPAAAKPAKVAVAKPAKVAVAKPAKVAVAKPAKAAKAVKAKAVKAKVKPGKPLAHGVGRRKSSVARVWLRRGSGKIVVNGKDYTKYFDTSITRMDAASAFTVVPEAQYDISANVKGGGPCSQAGAVRLGISRAMVSQDETLRPILRENGLLTCDSRVKERKKPGQKGARRKFQFTKR